MERRLSEQFLDKVYEFSKDDFNHEGTGLFSGKPAKIASALKKTYKNYADSMSALQYFENRWGTHATNTDLKRIEEIRKALRKLFKRNEFGEPIKK